MKSRITARGSGGVTLVEVMIVSAVIGMLAGIAIPNFVKARAFSAKNTCIANLKQIDGAKASWALEQKKSTTDTPVTSDLYGSTQYIRDTPECPGGGTYALNDVATKPT